MSGRTRAALHWLLTATVTASAVVLVTLVGMKGYLLYCRQAHLRPPLLVRTAPLVDSLFRRRECDDVYRVLAVQRGERFRTVWDFDSGVGLAKSLFVPTTMHGALRYRYKPRQRVTQFAFWSGLQPTTFSAAETPELRAALARCGPFHEAAFETDEDGFKRTGDARSAETETVLFVGDSFTEGMYVPAERTFVGLFGRRMREAGIGGAAVNGGVAGYGTLEEAWTVERFARPLRTRMAIACLFLNDAGSSLPEVAYNSAPVEVREHRYAEMLRPLLRLKDFCRTNGLELIVVLIPARVQVLRPSLVPYFQKRVQRWCVRNNVACLDALPYLRENGGVDNYFDWDPHLSEAGHQRFAEFLFQGTQERLREAFGRDPGTRNAPRLGERARPGA